MTEIEDPGGYCGPNNHDSAIPPDSVAVGEQKSYPVRLSDVFFVAAYMGYSGMALQNVGVSGPEPYLFRSLLDRPEKSLET